MNSKKNALACCLLLAASSAGASPYVGAGWRYDDVSVDGDLRRPVVEGQPVDLGRADGDDSLRLFAGWEFAPHWGIELAGYRVDASASTTTRLSATEEDERDASIDGTHVALTPYWRWPFAQDFALRAFAGVVYGDYSIEQSREIDVENGPDRPLSGASRDESEFGATAGVGVTWRFRERVELGLAYEYARTSVLSSSGVSAGVAWRF